MPKPAILLLLGERATPAPARLQPNKLKYPSTQANPINTTSAGGGGNVTAATTHGYATAGPYPVRISETWHTCHSNISGDKFRRVTVQQRGQGHWQCNNYGRQVGL
jgi:hypothetical protein